jgi:hypothetical protein
MDGIQTVRREKNGALLFQNDMRGIVMRHNNIITKPRTMVRGTPIRA